MKNKQNLPRKHKISAISAMHFIKFYLRLLIFAAALILYIASRIHEADTSFYGFEEKLWVLGTVWIVYTVEMALRFFPSRLESPGCQKQFKQGFRPTKETTPVLQSWRRTFSVAAAWFGLNGIIGALYYAGVIDGGILILVSLAYGVCDMICILFFCPFQTWFMKNRCCTDCRIYNWDFAMMFTPLVFIPHIFTYSLLGLSLLLLLRWEITFKKHPERFSVKTNACISCENCTEKLCKHKKQLISFIKNRKFIKR